jgi:hypothetical protein
MDVYLVYVKLGRAYVLPTLNIREVCTGGGMRGGGEDKGDSSTPLDGRGVLSTREEEAHGENSTVRKKSLNTEVVHKFSSAAYIQQSQYNTGTLEACVKWRGWLKMPLQFLSGCP